MPTQGFGADEVQVIELLTLRNRGPLAGLSRPGFGVVLITWALGSGERDCWYGQTSKYFDELRRRAVDEVLDRGREVPEVARSLGIGSSKTLRNRVRQAERDRGSKPGPTSEELAEIKKLRKDMAEQQRTIGILKAPPVSSSRRPRGNDPFYQTRKSRFGCAR